MTANEKLTIIADKLREFSGTEDLLGLNDMTEIL